VCSDKLVRASIIFLDPHLGALRNQVVTTNFVVSAVHDTARSPAAGAALGIDEGFARLAEATSLDTVRVVEVLIFPAEYSRGFGQSGAGKTCGNPFGVTAFLFFVGAGIVSLALFNPTPRPSQRLSTPPFAKFFTGAPMMVVVFSRCIDGRATGVKAFSTDPNIFGVLFHLCNVFVVFPPIDELVKRAALAPTHACD